MTIKKEFSRHYHSDEGEKRVSKGVKRLTRKGQRGAMRANMRTLSYKGGKVEGCQNIVTTEGTGELGVEGTAMGKRKQEIRRRNGREHKDTM